MHSIELHETISKDSGRLSSMGPKITPVRPNFKFAKSLYLTDNKHSSETNIISRIPIKDILEKIYTNNPEYNYQKSSFNLGFYSTLSIFKIDSQSKNIASSIIALIPGLLTWAIGIILFPILFTGSAIIRAFEIIFGQIDPKYSLFFTNTLIKIQNEYKSHINNH